MARSMKEVLRGSRRRAGGGAIASRTQGGGKLGGRGAARGGRSGSTRKRNFVSSTIPWQTANTDTDSAPTPLTFTEPTGQQIQIILPSSPQPVDFLSAFLDEDVLGHIVGETNR